MPPKNPLKRPASEISTADQDLPNESESESVSESEKSVQAEIWSEWLRIRELEEAQLTATKLVGDSQSAAAFYLRLRGLGTSKNENESEANKRSIREPETPHPPVESSVAPTGTVQVDGLDDEAGRVRAFQKQLNFFTAAIDKDRLKGVESVDDLPRVLVSRTVYYLLDENGSATESNVDELVLALATKTGPIKAEFSFGTPPRKNTANYEFNAGDAAEVYQPKLLDVLRTLGLFAFLEEEMKKRLLTTHADQLDRWYQDDLVNVDNPVTPFSEDASKAAAIVVVGESGAGKSQFALRLINRARIGTAKFTVALHLSLSETPVPVRRTEQQDQVHRWLSRLFKSLTDSVGDATAKLEICDLRSQLNQSRNDWALEALEKMILNKVAKFSEYAGTPFPSLLLVVDEIGRSLPMASALIDMVRLLQIRLFGHFAERVGLVLCGTGADAVVGENEVSFGTDPKKYKLTIMKKVDLDVFTKLLDLGKFPDDDGLETSPGAKAAFLACLRSGKFALPAEEEKLKAHLLSMQSSAGLMDYALRHYVNLNGLTDLTVAQRRALLDSAFLYLLKKEVAVVAAMKSGPGELLFPAVVQLQQSLKKVKVDPAIFSMGVCTRKSQETSPAMKYLICEGLTREVYPSTGIAFGELVAQHLLRYYEAHHKIVHLYTLTKQIPCEDEDVSLPDVKNDFQKMKKESPDASVYVIRQPSENNAPGPDLIVRRKEEGQWKLDLYQAKHLARGTSLKTKDLAGVPKSLFAGPEQQSNVKALEEGMKAVVCSRYLQASLSAQDMISLKSGERRPLLQPYLSKPSGDYAVLPSEAIQPTWDAGEAMLKNPPTNVDESVACV